MALPPDAGLIDADLLRRSRRLDVARHPRDHSQPQEDGRHLLTLEGYAYRWFRVGEHADAKQGGPDDRK